MLFLVSDDGELVVVAWDSLSESEGLDLKYISRLIIIFMSFTLFIPKINKINRICWFKLYNLIVV